LKAENWMSNRVELLRCLLLLEKGCTCQQLDVVLAFKFSSHYICQLALSIRSSEPTPPTQAKKICSMKSPDFIDTTTA